MDEEDINIEHEHKNEHFVPNGVGNFVLFDEYMEILEYYDYIIPMLPRELWERARPRLKHWIQYTQEGDGTRSFNDFVWRLPFNPDDNLMEKIESKILKDKSIAEDTRRYTV